MGMGESDENDTAGPLSPLNQDNIVLHQLHQVRAYFAHRHTWQGINLLQSLLTHQFPLQPSSQDQSSTPTLTAPPSRSPSPLSLSSHISDKVDVLSHSEDEIFDNFDSSEPHLECSTPDSESSEAHPKSPTSDSQSSHPTDTNLSPNMNVSQVREELKKKGFYWDDEKALERGGQAILDKASEIMFSQRHSPTSRENAPKLKEVIARFSGSNEVTMMYNVWKIMQGKDRDVIVEPHSTEQEEEAKEYVRRAWTKDYLDCEFNSDLDKDLIPDTSHTVSSKLDRWPEAMLTR